MKLITWKFRRLMRASFIAVIFTLFLFYITHESKKEVGMWVRRVGRTMSTSQPCVLPRLDFNEPSIMRLFKLYPKLDCGSEIEWVTMRNGRFWVSERAKYVFPDFICQAFPLQRLDDYANTYGDVIEDVKTGDDANEDFYKIYCDDQHGQTYENLVAGMRQDPDISDRPKPDLTKGLDLDVMILGQNSVSRMAMYRNQPKTMDYLVKSLDAIEMEGHTIVGDGTIATLMPMLLGKREEELPEARRGFPGAKPVDHFPWIWNKFKDNGYVTMFTDQGPGLTTFQYRLLGFTKPPVDHYWRPFSIAQKPYLSKEEMCQKSRSHYAVVLDYMRDMWTSYPSSRRKFAFTFFDSPSHEDNNKLSMVDEELRDFLKGLHDEGHLNNTLLIVMADHGSRHEKVRATDQGKLEERLPFFSYRFPPWFHEKYPEIISNMRHNAKMLTTPFDVHETFLEVLDFSGAGSADITHRAVSLFKKIPETRTCENADVDDHWCACLKMEPIFYLSQTIRKAGQEIIKFFNNKTASHRKLCPMLAVDKIISASQYKANDAVLMFKDSNDNGRGRWGTMTDDTKVTIVTYRVTLQTTPGGGQFEVSISRHLETHEWYISPTSVSRVNKYGDAANCVAKEAPHLRALCVCAS